MKWTLGQILLFWSAFIVATSAHAGGHFTYTGRILDSSGNPVTANSVRFTLTIYDPTGKCWLYTEQRELDLSASSGSFAMDIGSNDSSLVAATALFNGSVTGPQNMTDVFDNSKSFSGLGGANGCAGTYTPNSSEPNAGRLLAVFFTVDGGPNQALPVLKITPVPSALQAYAVNGYGSGELLKINATDVAASSIPNNPLTQVQYEEFWRLVKNPLGAYLPLSGDVSVVAGNNKLSSLLGQALPAGSATNGQVLVSNGTTWTLQSMSAGSVTSVGGTAPITIGGTASAPSVGIQQATTSQNGYLSSADWNTFNSKMSGALADGSVWIGNSSGGAQPRVVSGDAAISNAGTLTLSSVVTAGTTGTAGYVPVITYDVKGRITSVTSAAVNDSSKLPLAGGVMSGAITMGGNNIVNAGDITMAANKYFTLSTNGTNGTTAGQIWFDGANIKFFDGTSAQTLGVAGAGITSFNGSSQATQSFMAPGTSGNAPNWSTNAAAGQHALNIPMASSSASVTAGLISNTEYTALSSKQSSSLASGQVWVGNASSVATATDPATLFVMKGGQAGAVSLGTNDGTNLTFMTNNSTRLTIDSSGNIGIGAGAILNKPLDVVGTGATIAGLKRTDDTDGFNNILSLTRTRSSTTLPGAGFGGSIAFSGEYDNSNTTTAMGFLGVLWENNQTGALANANSAMTFSTAAAGITNEHVRITSQGRVGINTPNPSYPLSVAGTIESTSGGFRFPDGTTQTTAATSVSASSLTSAKIWVGNASNKPVEVSLGGDVTIDNAGVATVDKTQLGQASKILALDGSGVANIYGAAIKGATSGSVALQAAGTTANYSLTLPAIAPGAGQSLQSDAAGNFTWVNAVTSADGIVKNGNSFGSNLVIGTNDNYDFSFESNGTTAMTIKPNGNVGIGTADPLYKLFVEDTTINNPDKRMVVTRAVSQSTVDGAYTSIGSDSRANEAVATGITNSGTVRGSWIAAQRNAQLGIDDDGTLTNLEGVVLQYGHFAVNTGANPKTTNLYGIKLDANYRRGTITNLYDLYIGAGTGGTGTISNHYSLYQQSSTAKNYFNGSVGIGALTPATKLDISGVTRTTGLDINATYGGSQASLRAPGAFTSYTLTLPTTVGTSGQFLQTNGVGGLTWASPAGDSTKLPLAGGTMSGNINMGGQSITNTDVISASNYYSGWGNVSALAYSLGGGAGLYMPATDTLGIVTGGVERMRLDSSGNLAIGVTTPNAKLGVSGVTRTTGLDVNATYTGSQVSIRAPAAFSTYTLTLPTSAGAANQVMQSDGSGNLTWMTPVATSSGVVKDGNSFGAHLIIGTNDNYDFRFEANGATAMTIEPSGEIGIGTTTPGYKLDVATTDGSALRLNTYSANAYQGNNVMLYRARGTSGSPTAVQSNDTLGGVYARGYGATGFGSSSTGYIEFSASQNFTDANRGTYMSIYTTADNSTSPVERMRIADDGSVGVGVAPGGNSRLQVSATPTNATFFAIENVFKGDATANGTYYNIGVENNISKRVAAGVTDSGYLIGMRANAMRNFNMGGVDSGTLASLNGIVVQYGHYNDNAATTPQTTSAIGLQIAPHAMTGNIATMYDIYVSSGTMGGTVGNHYGLYIGGPTKTNFVDGLLGIGTSSPDQKLVVYNGSTYGKYTTSGWTHSSDVRLKTDIQPLSDSLNKILLLEGVSYKFKSDPEGKKQIGFIAQEVEPVFPEVVMTDKDGMKSMVYGNLVAPLVESVKALYAKLTSQDDRLKSLEAENLAMKEALCELGKQQFCSQRRLPASK